MIQYHCSSERVFHAVSTAYTSPLWRQQRPRSCYEPKKKRHDRLRQCFKQSERETIEMGKKEKNRSITEQRLPCRGLLVTVMNSMNKREKVMPIHIRVWNWYYLENVVTMPCSYQNVKKSINLTPKA